MAENFQNTVDALFKGMEEYITSKTVVGEAIHISDTIILPLMDVTFGVAASAKAEPQRHNNGGGMGGKISPSAVLVIKDGSTRMISVKDRDGITKLIDLVPDIVSRFTSGPADEEVKAAVDEVSKDEKKF